MKLSVNKREIVGKKSKNLRKRDLIPGSVYGPNRASTNIQVDRKEFVKVYKEVGNNKFFDLEIEGDAKTARVLVTHIQKNPITDVILCADFYQIDEDRKITVEVPIVFEGESPAVKQNLGFLIHPLDRVALHCYPRDLPDHLTVNISTLEATGDAITVAQLALPEHVELDSSIESTAAIVYIAAAQKEVVEEAPAETPAEGAEGEAAAATAEGDSEKAKPE
jgi:large subunit ribosomal protein L25